MKILHVGTTEEMVLNPEYRGLRTARIEVHTDRPGEHYPSEVGRIDVWNDDELFMAVREAIGRVGSGSQAAVHDV